MVAFLFMSKSLKAIWATRFFHENKAPWKIIPNYLTKHLGGLKFLLSCNYKFKELPLNELPPFYLNILQYWEEIRHITVPKDTITLNEIIIWNNSNIKVNGKTVYYQPWHCKGVTKLVDLSDNQNRFLAFDAVKRTCNAKTTFIDYYGLTHALAPLRTRVPVTGPQKQNYNRYRYDSLKNITNASLHKIFVKNKFVPPNTQEGMLSQGVKASELPKLYRCPFDTTN